MCPGRKRRRRLHRLYFRIYLTVLGVGLATVVAVGLAAWAVKDTPDDVSAPVRRAAEYLASDLPPGEELGGVLKDRAERLALHLTLYSPSGEVIARHGPALPGPDKKTARGGEWRHTRNGFSAIVRLEDGRWLAGAPARPEHVRGAMRFVHLLLLIALAVAAGCWPIARRLTRRLEALQRGVEELGTGDLAARVRVQGHDELAGLAAAFNRSAERIEALVAAQTRMLASASHELRSPLARLRMALALMEEGDEAQRRKLATDAARDVAELDELVGDLLLASRLEARERPVERGPVDLLGLVAEEAHRTGAEVGGEQVTLSANAQMLRRLVRNLLENARRYGEEPIEARVEESGGVATLTVDDRGPGVPEAERERIFEPFYRSEGHSEQRDGAVGLGLSLVREIAEAHGGSARCAGREGGGSRFEVTLPTAPPT